MAKKQTTANVANTVISIRDIWGLPNDEELYAITKISNTRIDCVTVGSWTDKFEIAEGTEYWPASFSIRGWEFYLKQGLTKVGELDKSIKI